MLKKILKNALFGIVISCSIVAVSVGAYAVVDYANNIGLESNSDETVQDTSTQQVKTLTLNATGGKFSINDSETLEINYKLSDGSSDVEITIPTKTNYTFYGFFSAKNGSGTKYIDKNGTALFTVENLPEKLTVYAYWLTNNPGGQGSSQTL